VKGVHAYLQSHRATARIARVSLATPSSTSSALTVSGGMKRITYIIESPPQFEHKDTGTVYRVTMREHVLRSGKASEGMDVEQVTQSLLGTTHTCPKSGAWR
jgi:hypothetical protein